MSRPPFVRMIRAILLFTTLSLAAFACAKRPTTPLPQASEGPQAPQGRSALSQSPAVTPPSETPPASQERGAHSQPPAAPLPPLSEEMPAIKKDCSNCHTSVLPQSAATLRKAVPALCLDCHAGRIGGGEHRIGVSPKQPETALPLQQGAVSCTTCHDMHQNTNGNLLRMPQPELCLTCHPY